MNSVKCGHSAHLSGKRHDPWQLSSALYAAWRAVIAVNELDRPERALEALCEERASLVAVGRGLIADPDWPSKMRDGRLEEIVVCTGCDACDDGLRAGVPVGAANGNGQQLWISDGSEELIRRPIR